MTAFTPRSIALVRHGETDWNHARRIQGRTEVPLNDTGRAQAAATARLLRGQGGWAGIVSSPLGRAFETSRIIGSALGLSEPTINHELIERNFGEAEGLLVADAQQRWPALDAPGAEPVSSVAERSARVLAELLGNAPASIVVAHGAMLRLGISELCGISAPRVLNAEVWLLTETQNGPPTARSLGIAHPAV